jgi:hypothetical protein
MKSQCWQHYNNKSSYVSALLEIISIEKTITNQNFSHVEFINVRFPEGISFRDCNFTKANLSGSYIQKADLRGCNFTESVMHDCHFESSDFRGITTKFYKADVRATHFNSAILQNVNFTGADMRDAIFIDADMIGAMLSGVEMYASRLLNTRLRKENLCNFEPISKQLIKVGDEFSRDKKGIPTPLLARYVYMLLKNNFRSIGEYADESWARNKEREMERKRLFRLAFLKDRDADALALEHWNPEDSDKLYEPRLSAGIRWFYRWILTFLGYGENPIVFLFLSAVTIIFFTFVFMYSGFEYSANSTSLIINRELAFAPNELRNTLSDFGDSAYMSVVTFTTLGYGDAHPIGTSKIFAAIEALLGFFAYSGFVATFLKKLSDE